MQSHQIQPVVAGFILFQLHYQRDMFEQCGERFELLHGTNQLFQVFQPAGGFGRFVHLQHVGVAGFIEDHLRQIRMRNMLDLFLPAEKALRQFRE